jgi:ribose-phosphate pyrophosphokinase
MDLLVYPGTAHRELGEAICGELGLTPAAATFERFPDGESHLELTENVSGRDVFIVQPLGAPVGNNVLDLLLFADACRRSGAGRRSAVIPYLGFARQDRRGRDGEPLSARVIADVIHVGGFSRVLVVDLHNAALEAAFAGPFEHLSAVGLLADATRLWRHERSVVVAPDLGAVKLAQEFARRIEAPTAIVHKTRVSGTEVRANEVIGDVRDMKPIIVDDMISTGGTIAAATAALLEHGCEPEITVVATHAILAGAALERLSRIPLQRLIVTDSLPQPPGPTVPCTVVSLAPLLAEAIRRLHDHGTMGDLVRRA